MEWHIRPLRDGEAAVVERVFAGLSEHSRYLRFHAPVPRLTGAHRAVLAHVGAAHVALVAETATVPVGLVRIAPVRPGHGELSVEVVDDLQRRGIGTALVRAATAHARHAGFRTVEASALTGNRGVLRLLRKVFEGAEYSFDGPVVRVDLQLGGNPSFTGADSCR